MNELLGGKRRAGVGFNQSSMRLDDSPKSRVQAKAPNAKCRAVYYGGRVAGYLVELDGKVIGKESTAYGAWLNAEAMGLPPNA